MVCINIVYYIDSLFYLTPFYVQNILKLYLTGATDMIDVEIKLKIEHEYQLQCNTKSKIILWISKRR